MTIDMGKYHRMYGEHSNIPTCCIDFFMFDWENTYWLPKAYHSYMMKKSYAEREIGKRFNYIPCPHCVKVRNWNKLHNCSKKRCAAFRKLLKKETGQTFPDAHVLRIKR